MHTDLQQNQNDPPARIVEGLVRNYSQISIYVEEVEGFMVRGQEEFLFNKVKSLPDTAVIVEIGSFKGRSTVAMGYACLNTRRKLFCIDTWDGNDSDFDQRNFHETWKQNIRNNHLESHVIPLKGLSHDILKHWNIKRADFKIDFIFIDGSHQYADVLKDFELAYPLVKTGGLIAFHDIIDTWPGPTKVWHETAKPLLSDIEYSSTLACGVKRNDFALHFSPDELIASSSVAGLTESPHHSQSGFNNVADSLPVHFFTIVLNGEPFIRHHLEQFQKLPFPWQWHIIEGVAELRHDTAWSLPNGGRINDTLHKNGLSNDGTTDYLDRISREYPECITLYRKPVGQFWDGKREMVNAPLTRINEECLLWQVDADELWVANNIRAMRELFISSPQKTAAYFHCDYFVGPRKYVSSLNTWATYPTDWLRVWRYRPGMRWSAHEPPVIQDQNGYNPASEASFSRDETMSHGITFQHFAYATESQVRFKEIYYGYKDAVVHWHRLQKTEGPVNPGDFLPWAKNDATVDDWSASRGALLMESRTAQQTTPKIYTSMSVDAETQFETELRKIFCEQRPSSIIETGTYLGQGTSSIIWRALRDFTITADFTTIEVNPEHHRRAVAHFTSQGMKVRAELGISVPREMLPNLSEISDKFITNREYDGIYYDHDESVRADRYFSETNFNVADDLLFQAMRRCAFKPEFVLLDSAGHMGFIEFQYFMSLIQGDCILMLDDIYHCKHYKTLQIIKQDPRFEIISESREKFGFCIARYSHVRSLLFIRTDLIGDNVLASAMLPHLQQKYPDAKITVVCQEHIVEIYEACPLVHQIIGFNLERAYEDELYRNSLLKQVRDLRADLCLNTVFSRTPLNDLIAVASGAKMLIAHEGDLFNIPESTRTRNNSYYTYLLPNNGTVRSELQRHLEFLSGIGIETDTMDIPFWVQPDDVESVDMMFRESGLTPDKTIALFAGAQDAIKRYDGYGAALAEICKEQGFTVVALGAKKDFDINQLNLDATGVRTLNLSGTTTIRQSGIIISRCRLAVGADTGLAHIACAVGVPNVILLGGWHWGRFLPYSPLTSVVSLPLECYGCNGTCRYDKAYCIRGVAPTTIAEAVSRTLTINSNKPRLFAQGSKGWQPQGDEPRRVPAESILKGSIIDTHLASH
jgi:ADP-heptose:LPS heptosyltransferase/predicted O-methyltransferase YrrM